MFQQVAHKGGESAINHINIFQNAKYLAISVVDSYTEDRLVQDFLDNLQQSGNYSSQVVIHQPEPRREGKIIDEK